MKLFKTGVLLCFAAVMTLLSGCMTLNVSVKEFNEKIIGEWDITGILVDKGTGNVTYISDLHEYYTFNADQTGYLYNPEKTYRFVWNLDSSLFGLKYDDGYYEKFNKIEFKGDELFLSGTYDFYDNGKEYPVRMGLKRR